MATAIEYPDGPPDTTVFSAVAGERFGTALDAASSSGSKRDFLRALIDELRAPVTPTAADARAAVWTAGLQNADVRPTDERIRDVLAPATILTPRMIAELTDSSEAGARRMAQVLRDEGRLVFEGGGHYRVPPPVVEWPATSRADGWVITSRGLLHAF